MNILWGLILVAMVSTTGCASFSPVAIWKNLFGVEVKKAQVAENIAGINHTGTTNIPISIKPVITPIANTNVGTGGNRDIDINRGVINNDPKLMEGYLNAVEKWHNSDTVLYKYIIGALIGLYLKMLTMFLWLLKRVLNGKDTSTSTQSK